MGLCLSSKYGKARGRPSPGFAPVDRPARPLASKPCSPSGSSPVSTWTAAGSSRGPTSSTCATPATRSRSPAATRTQGADELVFLDITASHEGRDILLDMVRRVAEQIFMPFTVGGGIRTLDDATRLIQAGAEKVSINSAAVKTPGADRRRSSRKFGRCATVVNIDPRRVRQRRPRGLGGPHQRRPRADRPGGRRLGEARRGARGRRDRPDVDGRRRHQGRLRPADDPGRGRGGEHPGRRQRRGRVSPEHLRQAFAAGADAALAASIFHYNEYSHPRRPRRTSAERGVPVRLLPDRR